MREIIPKSILSILPFKNEPIDNWNDQSDLLKFLYVLYDKEFSSLSAAGESNLGTYKSYGKHIFDTGLAKFQSTTTIFHQGAISSSLSPGSTVKKISIPDFHKSSEYGLMAKYSVAWDGIVGEILSESAFVSIAHTLESESELNCSILLASNLYYKQAFQVLRGFVETLVLPLFFINNLSSFKQWKEDNFHTPPLRGKNGMLSKLLSDNQIPIDLATEISSIYGTLNGYIHSSESKLIHKGLFTCKWNGQVFQISDFNEWCISFAKVVNVGIKLSEITISSWLNDSAIYKDPFCSVCHNSENFLIDYEDFAGSQNILYHCNVCGNAYRKKTSPKIGIANSGA